MQHHTIILATPKREIPKELFRLFIDELFKNNLLKLEYFGYAIDNQADYIDEEMRRKIDATTFIEVNFETESVFDYDFYKLDDVVDLVFELLFKADDEEFIKTEKDLTINLYL